MMAGSFLSPGFAGVFCIRNAEAFLNSVRDCDPLLRQGEYRFPCHLRKAGFSHTEADKSSCLNAKRDPGNE